jgi:glycerophosphoryl diester phosphodiesterase
MLSEIEVDDAVAITAHRGSSVVAPENTMTAIRRAIEDGSDYVEIDVQRTADGALILTHDKDMKRVSGVARNVSDMTFEEIRKLDVGSFFGAEFADERVPTLEEVIEVAQESGVKLNIELKFGGKNLVMARDVVDLVREKGFKDQCVVTSLNYAGVMEVKKHDPSMRTGLIVTASIGDVTRLEVDLLSVSSGAVSRDLIARAADAGKEVHVWTVNDVGGMNTMIHMSVDNIITDKPDVLAELLETRSKMSNAEKAMLRLGDILEGRL